MDQEYVEGQSTRVPELVDMEPHPSSPAGGVLMWGKLSRRIGPAAIRTFMLGALLVVIALLVIEILG